MNSRSIPLTCSGHTRPVVQLQFSVLQTDGTFCLISSCKDGNPILRDWTGDWIGTFLGHKGAVWSSKLSFDTSLAVTGSADFSAKVWDTYNGRCLKSFNHDHIVRSVAISPDGTHILTGGHEKKLRIFDLNSTNNNVDFCKSNNNNDLAHNNVIKSVLWQDSANAVSGSEDGIINWWDLRSKSIINQLDLKSNLNSLEWSCNNEMISAVSENKVIFFNSFKPGQIIKEFDLENKPSSASLHPISKDKFVVGSSDDTWVRIHNFDDGKELDCFKGHHGPVHTVEYSPDGEYFASGSEDGTIRLWQNNPGKSYGLWSEK